MWQGLFVAQRFNRVQIRGASRREKAENQANQARETEGPDDNSCIHHEGHLQELSSGICKTEAQGDADQSSQETQNNGFNEELCEHLICERANGKTNANLAGALSN